MVKCPTHDFCLGRDLSQGNKISPVLGFAWDSLFLPLPLSHSPLFKRVCSLKKKKKLRCIKSMPSILNTSTMSKCQSQHTLFGIRNLCRVTCFPPLQTPVILSNHPYHKHILVTITDNSIFINLYYVYQYDCYYPLTIIFFECL